MDTSGWPGNLRRTGLVIALVRIATSLTLLMAAGVSAPAQPATVVIVPPSFPATLSNTTPLRFGMGQAEAEAAHALGAPLTYVRGRPGDEILLAIRTQGGSGLFDRRDRLYLQFRKGRLTAWKGDWGGNWVWH